MRTPALLTILTLVGCAPSAEVRIVAPDFGVVSPGVETQLALHLHNVGKTEVTLVRVEQRSGAAGFTVTPGQVRLIPGERAEWKVSFTSSALGVSEARFAAVFDSGVAEFTVRARVAERCTFAETLDVGDARVGSKTSRTITVSNPLDEPGEVYVGSASSPFSAEPVGTLKLGAHESREVTVTFAPRTAGEPRVQWLLRPSADCTVTEVTLAGRAVDRPLSLAPGRLDFGSMPAGSTRTLAVEVQNHTRSPLTLTAASSSARAFTLTTQLPIVVPAEGRVPLVVEARAPSAEPFDTTLRLVTSALDQPELTLPLLANRITSQCLTASSAQLDFGSSEAGCRSHDVLVRVTNDCPHEVRVGDRTVSPGFALVASSPSSTLQPGDSLDFALTHLAPAPGETSGRFELAVDVLDGQQLLSVPIVGQVTPAVEVDESQVIPALTQPLDVLFVIDDSPEMLPLAGSVERNLDMFARYLSANGLDYRAGVMSSDTAPAQLGRLRRASTGAGWLDKPSPAELQAIGAVHGAATSRSSCLEALSAAFSDPLRHDPSELGGFLRPNAGFMVICITNGRDAIQAAPMPTISTLLSAFPRPYAIAVIANFREHPGCLAQLEHGPLTALAAHINGVLEDICTPNWAVALERVGKTAFGYRANYYLQRRPALTRGPLRVSIDEMDLPQVDPDPLLQSRLWTYDGAVNAVVFEPVYAPEPGKTLRFRFTPDCAQD